MKSNNSLELLEVSLGLDGTGFVGPLSLKIGGGDIVTIMGASGSGKSSLLNFICGNLPNIFSQSGASASQWCGYNEYAARTKTSGHIIPR